MNGEVEMNEQEMITISKKEYDELLDAVRFLDCLRAVGVDNWQGCDDACDMYYTDEEEEI